ncbi:MAG TPA: RNA 2',3'-cyclic phosphodiesterase, partial [Kiritimatiellia bacterium]|nr:RNA 2',3'-cyclic phosphodiesterase [Kiritimatiellia bacterium]
MIRRTFICLPLADEARSALSAVQERLHQEGYRLAYVDPDLAHLTLVFLGATPEPVEERLVNDLAIAARSVSPFPLKLGGGGSFGSPRAPKVVWVGVEASPALMRLQAACADAVRATGQPVESRPFRPHLTLARIRSRLPPGALTTIKAYINNTP